MQKNNFFQNSLLQKATLFLFMLQSSIGYASSSLHTTSVPQNRESVTEQKQTAETAQANDHYPLALTQYLKQLPVLKEKVTAQDIADFFCAHSSVMRYSGKDLLTHKIGALMRKQMPIELLLVGFSVKSSNPKRVLACKADFADFVGLATLNAMCETISKAYQPGAHVHIFNQEMQIYDANKTTQDGLEMDLFPEKEMEQYQRDVQKMISKAPFQSIKIFTMPDAKKAYEECRINVTKRELSAQDKEELEGMATFFHDDLISLQGKTQPKEKYKDKTKNKVTKTKQALKEIARQAAHALLIGKYITREVLKQHPEYDNFIRLSVAKSDNVAERIGINLINGSDGTPWQNLLLIHDNKMSLKKREASDKMKGWVAVDKSFNLDDMHLAYRQQETDRD